MRLCKEGKSIPETADCLDVLSCGGGDVDSGGITGREEFVKGALKASLLRD